MKNLLKVFSYIPHIKRQLVILAVLGASMSALTVSQPLLLKVIVDQLVAAVTNPGANQNVIWLALILLAVVSALSSVFNYFNNLYGQQVFTSFSRDLRQTILEHITELSIEYFEKNRTGAIMQRAIGNSSELANWFYNSSSSIFGMVLSAVFSLALVYFVSWPVGLLVTVGAVAFVMQQIPMLKRTRSMGRKNREFMEKASGYVQETVSHIATVRSFGGEKGTLQLHNRALNQWRRSAVKRNRIMQKSVLFRQITLGMTLVGAIGIITYEALRGMSTVGDILLISLYVRQITSSLWPLGRFFIETNEADITAERVVEMLETPPTVVDAPDARKLSEIKSIEFKNVSFSYPGKRKVVLDKISFEVGVGQKLALVGPSGTGKSTIIKLLLRFYDVDNGQILINDLDIKSYTQKSLRHHMGVVMQDVALFNDTIEANIHLARPEATDAELILASRQANSHDFIEKLPEKYETLVGERGVKLSGGEKQRVAIARAILRQPQLIVLDEATSALDSESEQQVQKGLGELMNDRMAIVIAHRLSTIMNSDQIVVMKEGKVVEQGDHQSLVKKKRGLYAKLVSLQRGGFIKD